jgi:hypothetical protein
MNSSVLAACAALLSFHPMLQAVDLERADVERLGHLKAQDARPMLISKDQRHGYEYAYGANVDGHIEGLLKNHAVLLERAAAHHLVVYDLTHNLEVFAFAQRLHEIRQKQANILKAMKLPDAGEDLGRLLAQGMAIGMSAKTNKEADEKFAEALRSNAFSHLGNQLDLQANLKSLVALESQAKEAWAGFLQAHPGLEHEPGFTTPLKELIAEHGKRGQDAQAKLIESPQSFYRTLLTHRSQRLGWTFDDPGEVVSIKVNEQTTQGIFIFSDVTMVVRGAKAGERTIHFKTVHQADRFGRLSLITLN